MNKPMKSPAILVIDDQESVRMLVKRVLENAGYQVAEAANGREGLSLFRATAPDLVITDLEMPDMDGLELFWELTSDFPEVKVIVMSGAPPELRTVKQLGARQIFEKPFDIKVLLRAVQYELRGPSFIH